ncbi:hypothetical protein [uncultured Succinivibrio sp.]|uniref:DUF4376 domain-containing protein n=1 Tax=uncultured Succinivibrio sp. TaxID=540749 RepID=UPI0025EE2238|nr:hypothetical protein [uncultured Succinivibrio sp.]
MSNTATAYQFDSNGYYLNETLVQKMGDDYLVPPDSTMTEPTFKAGFWTKWNGSKWTNEKIPTTCAEAIKKGLTCISNGQGKHNYEVKILLEALAAADSEHYKTVVSDNFVMTIEEIPEKTLDELKSEKLAELKAISQKYTINDCDEMYLTSSLGYAINADKTAQDNIRGLIEAHEETDLIKYKLYDNSFKNVTIADLKIMLKECAQNGENLYTQKFLYQEQINACATKEELEAIEIKFTMMDFSQSE